MPYIKVDTDKMKTYATEIDSARIVLNNTKQSIADVRYAMALEVRAYYSIGPRLDAIEDALYHEATGLTNMRKYLEAAIYAYDSGDSSDLNKQNRFDQIKKMVSDIASVAKPVWDAGNFIKDLVKSGETAKQITYTFKNGKMFLKGYKAGSGLTSRYNLSTWVEKGAFDNAKLSGLDKATLILEAGVAAIDAGRRIKNTWSDENKSTEKKVYDTVAIVDCTAKKVACNVAGTIVGKAAGGAVAAACCVIPVVGPVVGFVAGAVTNFVVGKAFSAIGDAWTSEEVVSQVSDSTETIVGTAKAGWKAVSDKAKEVAEAKGIDKVEKALEVAGTAVAQVAKTAVTAVVESAKIAAKVTVQAVKNFFKGW